MPETYDDRLDDPIYHLMASARPEVDTEALEESSVLLARQLAATPVQSRGRRRRTVAISLAAVVAMVPTTAAAYAWTTHTGIFGRPDLYTEDVDTSEILDLCAPDFPKTARDLMPQDLLLPEGSTLEDASSAVVYAMTRDCRDGDGIGARTQAVGVPAHAEGYAWCSWVNVYLTDETQQDKAADALRHYANSDLTHLVDADGHMTRWENEIADAAARGDAEQVRYEQRTNCGGGDYGWQP